VITLTGDVNSEDQKATAAATAKQAEKREAEKLAKAVPNVQEVVNESKSSRVSIRLRIPKLQDLTGRELRMAPALFVRLV
jgi:hypothetical protein